MSGNRLTYQTSLGKVWSSEDFRETTPFYIEDYSLAKNVKYKNINTTDVKEWL